MIYFEYISNDQGEYTSLWGNGTEHTAYFNQCGHFCRGATGWVVRDAKCCLCRQHGACDICKVRT